jgi:hypothetical protein
MFHQELCLYHGTIHKVDKEDRTLYLDHIMSRSLGLDQVEIHGNTNSNTSKLVVRVSCAHICITIGNRCNVGTSTGKYDQPIVYAYRLLNKVKHNYTITEREALVMVYALHKFRHFLLGNNLFKNVDHMALVYFVNKPHVSGRIAKWLFFLDYEFTIIYEPTK